MINSYSLFRFIFVVCIFLFLFVQKTSAQEPPENLWPKKVHALIAEEKMEFTVENPQSGKLKVHQIIYVMDSYGKKYTELWLFEDNYHKIKKVSGKLYDMKGKEIKKLQKEDIIEGNLSTEALYQDTWKKFIQLESPDYPYKVEYDYEIEIKSLFFWPSWSPQFDIPVLSSTYTLILKSDIGFKTYSIGTDLVPEEQQTSDGKVYTWHLNNIEPALREDFMPPENREQLSILFKPDYFELDNLVGSFKSWQDFASWDRALIGDRMTLSESVQTAILDMLNDVRGEREKLAILYRWLQDNSRYVSINLGIGGWQPHPADDVCKNKYGDCKDLSTLMVAITRLAGIEAYPVLIGTRSSGMVYEDFPSNQFNHVIVLALADGDSVWVECTADHMALGELPSDDEGCNVLVIDSVKGKMIRTPLSTSAENQEISTIDGSLLNEGTILLKGQVNFTGNTAMIPRYRNIGESAVKRHDWLVSQVLGKFNPQAKLEDFNFVNLEENYENPLHCSFKGTINRFGRASGKRIFFNPAIMNRETASDIPTETERKYPVGYKYAYTETDTLRMTIPDGWELEASPPLQELTTPFGYYHYRYSLQNQQFEFVRTLRIDQPRIPPEQYAEYLEFMGIVVKTDNSKFVLKHQ
jgi:hypothetical protein